MIRAIRTPTLSARRLGCPRGRIRFPVGEYSRCRPLRHQLGRAAIALGNQSRPNGKHVQAVTKPPSATGARGARLSYASQKTWRTRAMARLARRRLTGRRGSESNRRPRLCRPLHDHSATPPGVGPGTTFDERRYRGQTKRESIALSRKIWSGKRVSNSRPQPWQGCALPTELFPRRSRIIPSGADLSMPRRRRQRPRQAVTVSSTEAIASAT